MAKLPNAARAYVDPAKITDYLLCPTHPKGGPKCAFFESFGFTIVRWEQLRDALLTHGTMYDVLAAYPIDWGMMFEIKGTLAAPDGRIPTVLVARSIRTGEDFPRLVTVVPA